MNDAPPTDAEREAQHDEASKAEDERARAASKRPVDYEEIARQERDENPG